MMTTYTRGPWSWAYSNDTGPSDDYFWEFFEIVDSKHNEIARAEHKSDAKLIAAAPSLLEALQGLLEVTKAAIKARDWKVDGACDPDLAFFHAYQAINKALGDEIVY